VQPKGVKPKMRGRK